ncbi:HAD family hydrolase [Chitinilyticum aquatile]|uniref:HAD family hydrolase n=1 Tax=Chitinilyticum aquatile TaxID=362520 RepID=UPI00041E0ACC|nr:HAD family phosphatase [Chitinilyticum aquatile]
MTHAAPARLRAAIFDMDGLMLDTERIALVAWEHASAELAITLQQEAILGMVGMHSSKVADHLAQYLPDTGLIAELIACTHRHYLALTEAPIPHKAGIIAMLEWLAEQRFPCAVATSTRRPIAEHHLQAAGLWPYFEATVCGNEVTHPKPAPEIYLKAAAALGVAPQECLAFEDSNFGAQAAHAAGCRVIMIPDLREPDARTLALGIPVVRSLDEARALARNWLSAAELPSKV